MASLAPAISATIAGSYSLNPSRTLVIQPPTIVPSIIPVPFGLQQYVPADVQPPPTNGNSTQNGNVTAGQHPIATTQNHNHKVGLWLPILGSCLGAAIAVFFLAYIVNRFTWRKRFRKYSPMVRISWTFWFSNKKHYCPNHERTLTWRGVCPVSKKIIPIENRVYTRRNPLQNLQNYHPWGRDPKADKVDIFTRPQPTPPPASTSQSSMVVLPGPVVIQTEGQRANIVPSPPPLPSGRSAGKLPLSPDTPLMPQRVEQGPSRRPTELLLAKQSSETPCTKTNYLPWPNGIDGTGPATGPRV